MAEILWIGNGSNTSWHLPTNWQGGVVPDVGDTAVFTNAGTGNCLFNAPVSTGKVQFDPNWSGTFKTNGYSINCNGFLASQTTAGTIDLSNSTITNTGDTDFRGLTTNLITTGTTWIQKGGTSANRVAWRDQGTTRRDFARLEFAEGSFVRNYENVLYVGSTYFLGDMRLSNHFRFYASASVDSSVYIGEKANVFADIYIYSSSQEMSQN